MNWLLERVVFVVMQMFSVANVQTVTSKNFRSKSLTYATLVMLILVFVPYGMRRASLPRGDSCEGGVTQGRQTVPVLLCIVIFTVCVQSHLPDGPGLCYRLYVSTWCWNHDCESGDQRVCCYIPRTEFCAVLWLRNFVCSESFFTSCPGSLPYVLCCPSAWISVASHLWNCLVCLLCGEGCVVIYQQFCFLSLWLDVLFNFRLLCTEAGNYFIKILLSS